MSAVNTVGVLENVTAKQESVRVDVKLDGRNQNVKQVRDITEIIKESNNSKWKGISYFLDVAIIVSVLTEVN